jgi:hypothetical protein
MAQNVMNFDFGTTEKVAERVHPKVSGLKLLHTKFKLKIVITPSLFFKKFVDLFTAFQLIQPRYEKKFWSYFQTLRTLKQNVQWGA